MKLLHALIILLGSVRVVTSAKISMCFKMGDHSFGGDVTYVTYVI